MVLESSLQGGAREAGYKTVRETGGLGGCGSGLAAILVVLVLARHSGTIVLAAASKGRPGSDHGELKGTDAVAKDHDETS
jgi:hypothetical protein